MNQFVDRCLYSPEYKVVEDDETCSFAPSGVEKRLQLQNKMLSNTRIKLNSDLKISLVLIVVFLGV
jgi:hypothetical protein